MALAKNPPEGRPRIGAQRSGSDSERRSSGMSARRFYKKSSQAICSLRRRGGGGWIRFSAEKPGGCNVPPARCQEPPSHPPSDKKTATPDGVTVFLVEEGGFEPPKRNATDLQSAPFGHSGTPPDMKLWSWWTDSNPRPADYKSAALPAELHQHISAAVQQQGVLY